MRITDLTALGTTPASGDLLVLVDVSDTSMDATGTTKKVVYSDVTAPAVLLAGSYSNPSFITALAASKLSGAVAITNGGTGQITADAAINALLPTQTGNSAKLLTTNGTVASWTSRYVSAPVVLTDAATIATDASLSNLFTVTLGGNRTLGNPTNAVDGQRITWAILQDGTGTRTLAYDTKFRFGTDITGATLTTTINKTDYLTVIYRSGADKFDVIEFRKGY
jgi:hypothetical protein